MSTAKSPPPAVATDYESALGELEALVGRMDSAQMPLDELLSAYQRGGELLKFCRERLDAVEEQIKVLDNGMLKPWDGA